MKNNKNDEMVELFKSYGMSSPILNDDNNEKLYYEELKKIKDNFESEGMVLIFDGEKGNLQEEELLIDNYNLQYKFANTLFTIFSLIDVKEHTDNELDLFCPEQLIFATDRLQRHYSFNDMNFILNDYTYLCINNDTKYNNNIINTSIFWNITKFNHSSYNTNSVKHAVVQGWSFYWSSQSVYEWGWRFNCTVSGSSLPYNFFDNYNFYSSKKHYNKKDITSYLTYWDNFKQEFINNNPHFTQKNSTRVNKSLYDRAKTYRAEEGSWGFIYMGQWENFLNHFDNQSFGKNFSYISEYSDGFDATSYKPYKNLISKDFTDKDYLYTEYIDVGYMNGYAKFDDFYNNYKIDENSNCIFRSFNIKYVYKKNKI